MRILTFVYFTLYISCFLKCAVYKISESDNNNNNNIIFVELIKKHWLKFWKWNKHNQTLLTAHIIMSKVWLCRYLGRQSGRFCRNCESMSQKNDLSMSNVHRLSFFSISFSQSQKLCIIFDSAYFNIVPWVLVNRRKNKQFIFWFVKKYSFNHSD